MKNYAGCGSLYRMKPIDRKTVERVAHLSRIELGETEIDRYCSQLELILSYIDKLNEVDTSNTQPTTHALSSLKNVFRKDVLRKSLATEEALKNAPSSEGDFFKVPQIIEGK